MLKKFIKVTILFTMLVSPLIYAQAPPEGDAEKPTLEDVKDMEDGLSYMLKNGIPWEVDNLMRLEGFDIIKGRKLKPRNQMLWEYLSDDQFKYSMRRLYEIFNEKLWKGNDKALRDQVIAEYRTQSDAKLTSTKETFTHTDALLAVFERLKNNSMDFTRLEAMNSDQFKEMIKKTIHDGVAHMHGQNAMDNFIKGKSTAFAHARSRSIPNLIEQNFFDTHMVSSDYLRTLTREFAMEAMLDSTVLTPNELDKAVRSNKNTKGKKTQSSVKFSALIFPIEQTSHGKRGRSEVWHKSPEILNRAFATKAFNEGESSSDIKKIVEEELTYMERLTYSQVGPIEVFKNERRNQGQWLEAIIQQSGILKGDLSRFSPGDVIDLKINNFSNSFSQVHAFIKILEVKNNLPVASFRNSRSVKILAKRAKAIKTMKEFTARQTILPVNLKFKNNGK